jgi:DNA-binding NarL/FixJ family response regulator
MNPISLVIADDHAILLEGIKWLLKESGLNVLATCSTVEEILPTYEQHKPDVLLLDVRFSKSDSGIEAGIQLLQKFPSAKIVFMSQFEYPSLIAKSYKIGGYAYLKKNCKPEVLISVLQQVASGETYHDPEVLTAVFKHLMSANNPTEKLKKHELDFFMLLVQGKNSKSIKEELGISQATYRNYLKAIDEKLGVTTAIEMKSLAQQFGLIDILG